MYDHVNINNGIHVSRETHKTNIRDTKTFCYIETDFFRKQFQNALFFPFFLVFVQRRAIRLINDKNEHIFDNTKKSN